MPTDPHNAATASMKKWNRNDCTNARNKTTAALYRLVTSRLRSVRRGAHSYTNPHLIKIVNALDFENITHLFHIHRRVPNMLKKAASIQVSGCVRPLPSTTAAVATNSAALSKEQGPVCEAAAQFVVSRTQQMNPVLELAWLTTELLCA